MNVRFGAQIAAAAAAHHLDPQLLAAVAAQETGGPGASSGNNIVGDGGHGHGVFQIDDRSWGFAKTPAAMNPAQNANFAAGILADNLQRFGGNVKMALSAYNAGSPTATGTTTTWADGQTRGYADSVLKHYEALAAPSAGTPEELAAESAQTVADVNSLSSAHASTANPSVARIASPFGAILPQAYSPQGGSQSPFGAAHSWTQLDEAAQHVGQTADTTMASLVDEGDVFSSGGDDEA